MNDIMFVLWEKNVFFMKFVVFMSLSFNSFSRVYVSLRGVDDDVILYKILCFVFMVILISVKKSNSVVKCLFLFKFLGKSV